MTSRWPSARSCFASGQAMHHAKRTLDMVPADELVDLTQFSTQVVATSAVRLASRLRLADRVAQPFNLVISNVPGPRQPLYFAGVQLCHQFPVSIVTDGQGLNITVVSSLPGHNLLGMRQFRTLC